MLSAYAASNVLAATLQEKLATIGPRSIVGLVHERLLVHDSARARGGAAMTNNTVSRRRIGVPVRGEFQNSSAFSRGMAILLGSSGARSGRSFFCICW